MLRVVIDTGNAPSKTGIGVYSNGLLRALRAYGHLTISLSESTFSSTSQSLRPLHRLIYLSRLRKAYKRNYDGAEVLHFTNVYVPPKHKEVAYLGTVHDIDAILYPSTYSLRYRLYFKRMVDNSLRRADKILTDSEAARESILNYSSILPERVKAIGIGLSPEFIENVKLCDDSSFDRGSNRTILFVGSLSGKKNIAWTIRSLAAAVRSGALPRLKLVLAGGEGFGFNEIRSEINRTQQIVQWVKSPGLQSLVSLYKKADAVILPSRTEGFGIPLLEAMYCRKPIIASRIPSSVEVASSAANYFDLDDEESLYDAVRRALEDSNSQERIVTAQQQLSKYSWEKLAPQYLSVYSEAITIHRSMV